MCGCIYKRSFSLICLVSLCLCLFLHPCACVHVCVCVCYCTHMLALAWVCPLLAQVGVCLVFCVRADRMCDACQHAPGDERPEREWK